MRTEYYLSHFHNFHIYPRRFFVEENIKMKTKNQPWKLSMTSWRANSSNIGSSKNLLIDTSSDKPLRRLEKNLKNNNYNIVNCRGTFDIKNQEFL